MRETATRAATTTTALTTKSIQKKITPILAISMTTTAAKTAITSTDFS